MSSFPLSRPGIVIAGLQSVLFSHIGINYVLTQDITVSEESTAFLVKKANGDIALIDKDTVTGTFLGHMRTSTHKTVYKQGDTMPVHNENNGLVVVKLKNNAIADTMLPGTRWGLEIVNNEQVLSDDNAINAKILEIVDNTAPGSGFVTVKVVDNVVSI